jgi:hypothetical protein
VEEDMRRYWHEDITTTLIAHEELVAVQKRWENARALAKAKANSKEKMQDESNKSGEENDAQDDVPDATGGTDTAENTVSFEFWFMFVVTDYLVLVASHYICIHVSIYLSSCGVD